MEDMSRAHSVRSGSSGYSFNLGDIHEEFYEIEESKVYVAVGKEVEEWIENLKWLFKSIDNNLPIVFLHVHQPAKRIETPLGPMLADSIEQKELRAFRKLEKDEMNKCLKKYVDICTSKNLNATVLSTDNDDVARGLLELIKKNKVTDLVMGAGSSRTFSILPSSKTKEKQPKSKIAITLREKAEPSCRIRFISKGELICIREPYQNASDASTLSRSSSGSSSDQSMQYRTQPMSPYQGNHTPGPSRRDRLSISMNAISGASFPTESPNSSYPRSSSISYYPNLDSEIENQSMISESLPPTSSNNSPSSSHNVTDDISIKLEETMAEAAKLKREAYEESSRRSKAELDLFQTSKQIKSLQNMLNAEMQKKLQTESKFARQNIEFEKHKKMYEQAQHELMKTKELLSSLDSQNVQLRRTVDDLRIKFEETNALVEKLTQDRDVPLREVQQLNCVKFTYLELQEATKNFNPRQKIGEGGFGAVYVGFLRHTKVAIKILKRDSVQGDPQFFQEIEILSRIRHPHLVTLIGACLEARALVYEYVALGSLDNHLTCKDHNRPLPWQVRVRVAHEVCLALIFLHSENVVHGDIKPENVLLDSNLIVKLSDLGICRQVHMTNVTSTPLHITEQPRGTFPYMDPEYFGSGEITTQYDVFSFGIVLLQLVTGSKAMGLKNAVEDAIEKQQVEKMVDPSASWPLDQAMRMIQIGLRCSNTSRRKRPDLKNDVYGWLESIANVASASLRRSLTRATC